MATSDVRRDSSVEALARLAQVQRTYPLRSITVGHDTWKIRDTGGDGRRGDPVLALPGIQGGADTFFEVAHALGRDHRFLLVDAPDITGLDDMTTATAAFLDDLDIPRCHVLASSLGGYLAQDLTIAFPDRVGQLMLANTFYDPAPFLEHQPPASALEAKSADDLLAKATASLQDEDDDDAGQRRLKAVMRALIPARQSAENYKSRLLLLAGLTELPPPRIDDSDVLLIDNNQDPLILPVMREQLRRRFSGAERHSIDDGGHQPAIQRPDAFIGIVGDRLATADR